MRCTSFVVVWVGGAWSAVVFSAIAHAQVEIPEGFEVVEIYRSERLTVFPDINDCGQIVFDSTIDPDRPREILLYDNGTLRRITDNDVRDRSARINAQGDIVWVRAITSPDDQEVILLRDGQETVLDATPMEGKMVADASINDLGWVAWGRGDRAGYGCEGDLMLWDGETTQRITEPDGRWELSPQLNALGDIAWQSMNVCVNPWTAETRLYTNGEVQILPSSEFQLQLPGINDLGHVAWTAGNGVEFWNGRRTRMITDRGRGPRLNNAGDVYMYRTEDNQHNARPWIYRIDSGRFFLLVDDPAANHSAANINNWGEAVWHQTRGPQGREFAIMELRRIRNGDSEFDGSIGLDDYTDFADCMTGSVRTDRLCDCRFLDLDYDGDVDLGDLARFQNAYQGP